MSDHKLMLLGCNANPDLNQKVSACLEVPLAQALVSRFNNGEIRVQVGESVRDADCFILQSLCASRLNGQPMSLNDNLIEMLVMADALVRAGAYRIVAVVPHFGYARQDKKTKPREPISASLLARLMEESGIARVMAFDLHNPSIQGFFRRPVDNLPVASVLCDRIVADGWVGPDSVVVSPDLGGTERANQLAERLGIKRSVATIVKHRPQPGVAEAVRVIGKISGLRVLIIDDIIDTGGSIVAGAQLLRQKGAKAICVAATHGVFSDPAIDRLYASNDIDQVFVTDTIPQHPRIRLVEKKLGRRGLIQYISIAPLLSEAIRCNHEGKSVHELFR
jgi:ribose-phosphate pyrophosphokinase